MKCVRTMTVLAVVLICGLAQHLWAAPQFAVNEVNLKKPLETKGPVTLDGGGGVKLQFGTPSSHGLNPRKLTVLDGQTKVKQLDDELTYGSYARVEFGPATYWVIAGFTGGAHCCALYEFFCRPAPGQPLRYLDHQAQHDGDSQNLQKAFIVKDNQLYFRDGDNRFDYFHSSYAGCMLIRFPDRHWLLSPTGIKLANIPFRAEYLAQVPGVEQEITKTLRSRKGKPQAILKKEQGGGFYDLAFSDDLGQLLVKRAILLLYAREEARAWQELEAGVKKHYQSTRWLPELKRDIQKQLASAPY